MGKYPVIIDNFIPEYEAVRFEKFLSDIAQDSPFVENYRIALGYPNSVYASKVGYSEPVIQGYENTENEQVVKDLGDLLLSVKEMLEADFLEEMGTVQYSYHQMLEGARNRLHSDSTKLDGSPLNEDGTPEEVEWSALLYLTSYEEDFSGGEIEFPNQGLVHKPMRGQLMFFKGDVNYPHKVHTVTGGLRSALVFFFGRRGNTSEARNFG
jgi:hypothetical protein